jgi:hypothetical protein
MMMKRGAGQTHLVGYACKESVFFVRGPLFFQYLQKSGYSYSLRSYYGLPEMSAVARSL